MKTTLKKLIIGKTTSTIIVEHSDTNKSISSFDEVTAIAILLGGYNRFGRKIDVIKYQKIKTEFDSCVAEIKALL